MRAGADAVRGQWIELTVGRQRRDGSWQPACHARLFTSLLLTSANVARIARCGRALEP